MGTAVIKVALERWVGGDDATLADRIRETFDELGYAIAGRANTHRPWAAKS